jgi:hypothetical protein
MAAELSDPTPTHFDAPSDTGTQWKDALLWSAVSSVLTVIIYLGVANTGVPALSFLVIPTGGAFCAFLYARRHKITNGQGARLGAITGFISYSIFAAIVSFTMVFQRDEMFATLQKALKEAAAKNPNPQAEAMVQQFMTPAGIATLLTVSAVIFLFIFLVLGALGGSAGAAMSRSSQSDHQ